jgi:ABC-type glycerol-3-phosphate transport system substrate-binding protein
MNSETKIRWKSPLYVQALSIYSKSEKKDAAFEFMKWMATDRYAQTNSLGSFPVCNDILSDPSFLTEFPAE